MFLHNDGVTLENNISHFDAHAVVVEYNKLKLEIFLNRGVEILCRSRTILPLCS